MATVNAQRETFIYAIVLKSGEQIDLFPFTSIMAVGPIYKFTLNNAQSGECRIDNVSCIINRRHGAGR